MTHNSVKVPAGIYRLLSCTYSITGAKARFFGLGSMNSPGKQITVQADKTVSLPCGPPLHLLVSVVPTQLASNSLLAFSGNDLPGVNLRAQLVGAGGETYAAFYRGERLPQPVGPRLPRYEIVGSWFGRFSGMLRRENDGSFTALRSLPSNMANQPARVTVSLDLQPLGFSASAQATETFEVKPE